MSRHELVIEGARQNNLKSVNLKLPHNKVIAVTGVSGSGKSSLALDTIFAEGQWRFIESLSTYARLFLEKLDRPDVDSIRNIRPAIALEQRNPVRGSRSTVGTITEIYDYMRLLFSKVSTPYCPGCGKEIRRWNPSDVVAELVLSHLDKKAMIIFKTERDADGLKRDGFLRALVGDEMKDLDGTFPPPYDIILDRLVIRDEPRLGDSIETAFREGGGRVVVRMVEGPALVFSAEYACDDCGVSLPEPSPLLFSFNHPLGACPECKGFGNVLMYDPELVVPDPYLTLSEGAVEPWEKPAAKWWRKQMMEWAKAKKIPLDVPYGELPEDVRKKIFKGDEGFYGVNDFFEELESKRYKLHVRVFLARYRKGATCPSCGGARLRKEALQYRIGGAHIGTLIDMPVSTLRKALVDLDLSPFQRDVAAEPLRQIGLKLGFLSRVGLDYLGLSRQGRTLSGGEYQRVTLSNQLASRLTGTLYVLDEPTVGLHPRDTDRVSQIMAEISEAGNTIVVVEHDKGVIEKADWVVELGPGGGKDGGEVVFAGSKEGFLKKDTLTARYIKGLDSIKISGGRRRGSGELVLAGARGNNLKGVELRVPLGTLTAVTGVSGSGKSSLVVETLYRALAKKFRLDPTPSLPFDTLSGIKELKSVKLIDQSSIGRSPRSNPVTYIKIFDRIRKLFSEQHEARAAGYGPGFFSFNVPGGRCEACKGEGWQKVEMYFFEDLYVKCEECGGKRYGVDALRVRYRGHTVEDVLNMTVEEAVALFADQPQISSRLSLMADVGLGYLRLGQPATTLSGGEAQRLKICSELAATIKGRFLYILDEPTVGLHMRDVEALLNVLDRLVRDGNTVLVIEHNLDVIKAADWIIDLGPEGGEAGGRIIFEGTPEEIAGRKDSHTGKYLKDMI